MSKLQFYGIFVLSVLCGAALSESWKIGISIEDTAIVVNFSIGFFRLPLLSKTWIWSKIQIGITAGRQINSLNNNLLQWTNVLRCFVRDSYLKIYMCLQTNLKTQENKNARAIFKTRNCTFIVHQEGGAADKKCQAFAISPQFAFNSARYGGNLGPPWKWLILMQSQISGQAHCSLFVFICFYLNLCLCFYSDIEGSDSGSALFEIIRWRAWDWR